MNLLEVSPPIREQIHNMVEFVSPSYCKEKPEVAYANKRTRSWSNGTEIKPPKTAST